jgi:endonuclease YncB( thermonuclease family)
MKRRAVIGLLAAVALAALAALFPSGEAEGPVAGTAQVVDGDTLTVAGQRIRLHGVDAPEANQLCERGGQPWRCGADATEALRGFLAGRPVACTPVDRDRFGRLVARCAAEGQDLGAWLVGQGLAVAYTDYSWRYVPAELSARWHGRGIWGGSFQTPAEHRRAQR